LIPLMSQRARPLSQRRHWPNICEDGRAYPHCSTGNMRQGISSTDDCIIFMVFVAWSRCRKQCYCTDAVALCVHLHMLWGRCKGKSRKQVSYKKQSPHDLVK
jgi:hypothetical protein